MKANWIRATARVLPFLIMASAAYAQGVPPGQQGVPPGQAAAPPAQSAPAQAGYSAAQLDQMLAPIALYPDELVTDILMASTYPLEVVEAERWLQDPKNAALKGDALVAALRPLPWDPSVKSLVPFPETVKQLNDHLDWLQDLGNAFASQQAQVMQEVQHLRQQAQACGTLKSTPQMTVAQQGSAIAIAPADPQTVYMPVYDPATAYGQWAYPAYPPLYFPPPPGFVAGGIGFGFGVGIGLGFSVGFGVVGPFWGWASPNWGGGYVNVNVNRVTNITNNNNMINNRFAGGRWHAGPAGSLATARHSGAGGVAAAHGAGVDPAAHGGRGALSAGAVGGRGAAAHVARGTTSHAATHGVASRAATTHASAAHGHAPAAGGFHARNAGFRSAGGGHAPAGGFGHVASHGVPGGGGHPAGQPHGGGGAPHAASGGGRHHG